MIASWDDFDESWEVCADCGAIEQGFTWDGRCEVCGEYDPDKADYSEDICDEPSGVDEWRFQAEQARRLK